MTNNKIFLSLLCALSALALASCAPSAKKTETFEKIKYEDFREFTLGVSDSFEVAVVRHNELNTQCKVDTAGMVTLPLVGDVFVAGKGITAVHEEIVKKYSKYFNAPQVIIKVTDVQSTKAIIAGELQSPGIFTIKHNTRLSDAILMAGGYTADANLSEIIVIRRVQGGKPQVTTVDFESVLSSGDPEEDIVLADKDILYVPKKGIAVTAAYMTYIGRILSPVVTLESSIILAPKVKDAFTGTSDAGLSITP